jgi:hypothetical protein
LRSSHESMNPRTDMSEKSSPVISRCNCEITRLTWIAVRLRRAASSNWSAIFCARLRSIVLVERFSRRPLRSVKHANQNFDVGRLMRLAIDRNNSGNVSDCPSKSKPFHYIHFQTFMDTLWPNRGSTPLASSPQSFRGCRAVVKRRAGCFREPPALLVTERGINCRLESK